MAQGNALPNEEFREDERLIGSDFERRKSLEARAYRNRIRMRQAAAQNDSQYYGGAANDAGSDGSPGISRMRSAQARLQNRFRRQTASRVGKKMVSRATVRWALVIAGTVSFWQAVCGLISLLGFAIHAVVLSWKSGTVLGKIVGFFVDIEKYIPGETLGMGFWAIATLIGLGGFIGFVIFFYLTNVRMASNAISLLVMAVCFAFILLPVTNIFFPLTLWIVYLNATSLFSKS